MTSLDFTTETRNQITFCYDPRSLHMDQIRSFIDGSVARWLQDAIREKTLIALGGDGLMIRVAKEGHISEQGVLGINFGSKWFLMHERSHLETHPLKFDRVLYPILHATTEVYDSHDLETPVEILRGHAFNEIYTRVSGDASSLSLRITHRDKEMNIQWDGLMISTPAGSTGWNKSYYGSVLAHTENSLAFTPVGVYSPSGIRPTSIADKGRVRIENNTIRTNPLDILVDNKRLVAHEARKVKLTIERATRGVYFLIQESYRADWDNKPYAEIGFTTRNR